MEVASFVERCWDAPLDVCHDWLLKALHYYRTECNGTIVIQTHDWIFFCFIRFFLGAGMNFEVGGNISLSQGQDEDICTNLSQLLCAILLGPAV